VKEKLEIPGQRVSQLSKKLWETQSFSKVEVYVQDVEGQNVILQFQLQDLKELGEIKFTGKGIGKSKNEKLIKDNNLKPGTKINNNLVSAYRTKFLRNILQKALLMPRSISRKKLMQEILIWWTGQLK
jgi:outer membrane protein insertion porin family